MKWLGLKFSPAQTKDPNDPINENQMLGLEIHERKYSYLNCSGGYFCIFDFIFAF